MNHELGVLEIDAPAARLLDPPADLALGLRRRQRKPLVGAPHRDPEALARAIAEIVQDRRGDAVQIEGGPADAYEKFATPNDPPDPLADGLGRGGRPEHELDSSHQRANGLDVEIGHGLAQIAHEPRHEPRPVLSFERDLLVVDDDRGHRAVTTRSRECRRDGSRPGPSQTADPTAD